jgi:hypothetical protein
MFSLDCSSFLRGLWKHPETLAWLAIRMDKSTFGLFDAFPGKANATPTWRAS